MPQHPHEPRGPAPAGSVGELVCCNPFPSRPLGLQGDPDGSRFHQAYFAANPPSSPEQAQQALPLAFLEGYHVAFYWGAGLFAAALVVAATLINAHKQDIPADLAVAAE